MLRQIVLYSNPNKEQAATGVRLVFEAPAEALEVAAAVMSDGYDRVKSEVRREAFEREGRQMVRATCPMWDTKPVALADAAQRRAMTVSVPGTCVSA